MTMAKLIVFALLVTIASVHGGEFHCTQQNLANAPTTWKTMVDECFEMMKGQVQMELNASMTYLAMGSHFLQDKVNRPGFAKFFLDSASEERQHALKLLEYLLMRGKLTDHSEFVNIINDPKPEGTRWRNGAEALKEALELETKVTKSINKIIITCEEPPNKFNDYHLVDWLTADFLDEQYKGQRDLAGKYSTLSKMMKEHSALGEFLFDKTLL